MLFILHQVNCKKAFGCGFAGYLKKTFPQAETAYLNHFKTKDYGEQGADYWYKSSREVLGTYSKAKGNGFTVINVYSQEWYGNSRKTGRCYTSYKAMEKALLTFREYHPNDTAICPQYMGCGLAGGDWKIVKPLLDKYNIIPCDKIDLENRVYHKARG